MICLVALKKIASSRSHLLVERKHHLHSRFTTTKWSYTKSAVVVYTRLFYRCIYFNEWHTKEQQHLWIKQSATTLLCLWFCLYYQSHQLIFSQTMYSINDTYKRGTHRKNLKLATTSNIQAIGSTRWSTATAASNTIALQEYHHDVGFTQDIIQLHTSTLQL